MLALGVVTHVTSTGLCSLQLQRNGEILGEWNCEVNIPYPHLYRVELDDQFCYPVDLETLEQKDSTCQRNPLPLGGG